jgi:hypothetical protein
VLVLNGVRVVVVNLQTMILFIFDKVLLVKGKAQHFIMKYGNNKKISIEINK